MPSPFPGMDPYLEDPEFYPDFHTSFITYLREALLPQVRDPYYLTINARAWIEYSQRLVEPVLSVARADAPSGVKNDEESVAVAVAVRPVVVYVPDLEVREPFIEVRMVRGERQLVAAIEVLSPSNKTPGEEGRGLYLKKQRELLARQVNLVEIDLLRGGEHTTAVPRDRALAVAGPFDYHVCIRQIEELREQLVYPIRMQQSLPEIIIPLLPGDPGLKVSLQQVFERCYEVNPCKQVNPYRDRKPHPPLTPEQAAWAETLLRERGLLPKS